MVQCWIIPLYDATRLSNASRVISPVNSLRLMARMASLIRRTVALRSFSSRAVTIKPTNSMRPTGRMAVLLFKSRCRTSCKNSVMACRYS